MSPDEEALLAAVTAAPHDDAPRLVYADWLEERSADAKAEYLRTVVKLVHPPEDPAVVARCLAAAQELEADWRQLVGARFEVTAAGAGPLLAFAHMVRAVLDWAFRDVLTLWEAGQPVPIRRNLTREDAERVVQQFGSDLSKWDGHGEPLLRVAVRPMGETPPPVRLALPAGPRPD